MTKIYVSADIEGILGVVSPEHCDPKRNPELYAEAVEQMGLEVSWVVEAALNHGATSVLVNDSHYSMTNLSIAHLPESSVELLSGKPKAVAMSAGLDSTFDAAFYIGYHAKAGTRNGVLCHTFHDSLLNVEINGQSLGEGGVNAYYASLVHGVPVVLASGDDRFCQEISAVNPHIKTVETKVGYGFSAAKNHSVDEVAKAYESAVALVMKNRKQWQKQCLKLKGPYELVLTLVHPVCVDAITLIPNWECLDGLRVRQVFTDFHQLYLGLQSAYGILSYAKPYYG